ncbi:DUF3310 domain-containing protein [bacterium]|nr:DUF3310 domain-containing protein [bacterium]
MSDPVNHPNHYTKGGVECIDAIQSSMSEEAFRGYCKGNIQKYIYRYEDKQNPKQDLLKARWYLDRLLQTFPQETQSEPQPPQLLEPEQTHLAPGDISLSPQELDCLRILESLDLLDQLQGKKSGSPLHVAARSTL